MSNLSNRARRAILAGTINAKTIRRRKTRGWRETGFRHNELYAASPVCTGQVKTRWSGVKCTKCLGWYCA